MDVAELVAELDVDLFLLQCFFKRVDEFFLCVILVLEGIVVGAWDVWV